ncbi:diaminohydroxyphosphoribosylaminopyrimidine deaminase [Gracilibacillus boraciitolerans JCM 21714]|uniref:Diaminohydroxyphosphoribosylaminopyrimidine deaminase n=1 Tax=Gracilibacillus boraciitolerans JCM 21714 TaxID=1298598 RepID=W4VJE5_9BACI|nr:diaminohydroxyphosphoribosylaminopyrimidine deaminase [Gracilibacillus boraciitolerans JCM 21714]
MPTEQINLNNVMEKLAERNIQSLYVEGGATVHQSFLKQKLVDECHWYIAPKLLGGQDAQSAVGGNSPQWMKDAFNLTFVKVEQLGEDLKIIAVPKEDS